MIVMHYYMVFTAQRELPAVLCRVLLMNTAFADVNGPQAPLTKEWFHNEFIQLDKIPAPLD
jgi:hypothetical protein